MCLCGAGDGCRDMNNLLMMRARFLFEYPVSMSAGSGGLGVMSGKPENWENAGNAGKIIKISICILIFME